MIRVRFAPSPTGLLHIGNVHTALFNWLFARVNGGKMILRIEDTDQQRSQEDFEGELLADLAWLGLDWDEGADVGGDYGPYRQSERLPIYQRFAEKLAQTGFAYPCYCTPEELAQERVRLEAKGQMPRYSGRCRQLTAGQRQEYEKQGVVPSWRFRVPEGREIVLRDMIRQDVVFNTGHIGDFVIMRPNGFPTYNFSVTIDDVLMKITHVIRADEHISNTPRQMLLYEALDAELPIFAHVSMLLGPDRTKLSKRHGAASLMEFRREGYLPEALINYLALLGWSPPGEKEILSVDELIEQFQLERVSKSPAVFDLERLRWVNSQYLRTMEPRDLAALSQPYLEKAGFFTTDKQWLLRVLELVRAEICCLAELPEHVDFLFGDMPTKLEEKALDLLQKDEVREAMEKVQLEIGTWPEVFSADEALELVHTLPERLGLKKGQVFRPLRAAVTGKMSGPELFQVLSLLGKERILARLHWAKEKSSGS